MIISAVQPLCSKRSAAILQINVTHTHIRLAAILRIVVYEYREQVFAWRDVTGDLQRRGGCGATCHHPGQISLTIYNVKIINHNYGTLADNTHSE